MAIVDLVELVAAARLTCVTLVTSIAEWSGQALFSLEAGETAFSLASFNARQTVASGCSRQSC